MCDAALEQAMLLFWRHGYEATSLTDLTSAMGVTPPSIYAAFGDKKRLFLAAVDRYVSGPVNSASLIASAPSARAAALALLSAAASGFTGEHTPPGCLLASAAISCSTNATDVQQALAAIRLNVQQQLGARIRSDMDSGAMPADCDGEALAAHVMATIQGMSTLARDGASRDMLQRVASTALRAWPNPGGVTGRDETDDVR